MHLFEKMYKNNYTYSNLRVKTKCKVLNTKKSCYASF